MVLKINRHHPSAWRNLDDFQLSVGDSKVVLENIGTAEQNMLALLYRGVADAQYPALAASIGLEPKSAALLIDRLEPLLERPREGASARKAPSLDQPFIDAAIAEITRSSLDYKTDGQQILRQRQTRVVHVDSLGKAGLGLVRGLVEAGIGKVISHDNRPVQARDLGADGYELDQLGSSRFLATNQILGRAPKQSRLANGNRMSQGSLAAIDAAVLISQQVIEPRRYANWQNRDVAHLAITFGVDEVLVSPVIMPGSSPCLLCFDLSRAKVDDSWPVVSMQLVKSPLRFDDVASRFFANGLAIRQLLSVLDRTLIEPDLAAFSRGYRLDLTSQKVTELSWPKLSSCSCSGAANSRTLTLLAHDST